MLSIGILALEQLGSPLGAHGMGRRGTFADLVDITDGFHKKHRLSCFSFTSIANWNKKYNVFSEIPVKLPVFFAKSGKMGKTGEPP